MNFFCLENSWEYFCINLHNATTCFTVNIHTQLHKSVAVQGSMYGRHLFMSVLSDLSFFYVFFSLLLLDSYSCS